MFFKTLIATLLIVLQTANATAAVNLEQQKLPSMSISILSDIFRMMNDYTTSEEQSQVSNLDAKTVPDFIASFIYGITGDNDVVEIETRYQVSKEVSILLKLALDDLKKGGTDNEIQAAPGYCSINKAVYYVNAKTV